MPEIAAASEPRAVRIQGVVDRTRPREAEASSAGSRLCVALAAAALLAGQAAAAEGAPAASIAVLRLGGDPAQAAREKAFVTALELALDDFQVHVIDAPDQGFAQLPLKAKLDRIDAATRPFGAAATVWIECVSDDLIMLHVVAIGTGRAFIRIVEVPNSATAERELAVAATELVGQVYLLAPAPAGSPVEGAVKDVMRKAEVLRERPTEIGLAVVALLRVEGAVYGQSGAWARVGGGLALDVLPSPHLLLRAGFTAVAGPFADPRDGTVSGYGIAPEIGAGWLWRIRFLSVGPVLQAAAIRTALSAALGDGTARTYSWWSFRGALGLEVRFALSHLLSLSLSPAIGVWSHSRKFLRVSDDSVALVTPLLDWSASAGVCYNF